MYSKYLFITLDNFRNSLDRSISSAANVIRYEFDTYKVNRMIWIAGKGKLADPLARATVFYLQPLQLSMFSAELTVDFNDEIERTSNPFTG